MSDLRERILDAGAHLICDTGWDRVTMSQLARRAGISRQMVYKEFGSRDDLARAIISRHADRFLAGVVQRLRDHTDDIGAGVSAAVGWVLRAAADDPLLKAVLSAAHGGTQDLLPLLTTNPEPVLERAVQTIYAEATALWAGFPTQDLGHLVEVIVRLTISHLIQPFAPVDHVVAQAGWLVDGTLAKISWPRDAA